MGGKEYSQEDTQYYEKVSFEMNILVCGDYKEENPDNEIVNEGGVNIIKSIHKSIPQWKYFYFPKDENIGKNTYLFIKDLIQSNNDHKNLLVFYSGYKDFTSENLLKYYDEKVKNNYYPIIIIITKQNENFVLPDLKKLNKNFIKIFKEDNVTDILINMIEISSYYNQLGDEIGYPKYFKNNVLLDKDNYLITKYQFTINILLCGKPGAGKSTLINRILGKEKSYSKIGSNTITTKIIKYIHEKYPLVLYDSPGFESENNIKSVQKLITQKNESLNEEKNRIHCIFYLLNKNSERGFLSKEYPFIASLIKQKIDIFIVTTHAESINNSEEYIEETRIQILQNSNGNENIENLRDYIYPVELKNENNYKRFGIKKLFNSIYKKYVDQKVLFEINQRNIKQVKSKFLEDILTKERLKKNLTALSLRVKANFKLLAASLGKGPLVKGTTMLTNSVIKIISNIYNHKLTSKESIDIIIKNGYTNELEEDDKLIRTIEKCFASLFYFNGPASKEVDYIADYLIKIYNKEIDNDDRLYYKFLNDFRIAVNNAIDSLNYINDE